MLAHRFALPLPLVVSALVNFSLAPLRRIRLLLTVENDLIDEGVIPGPSEKGRGGFGGPVGCARFLYQLGGVRAFYRGAMLELGGVLVKYFIQVSVVLPVVRSIPLQMQRSYMLTTLIHTIILFFPVAPIQVLIDTVIVNACADFTRKEGGGDGATGAAAVAAPATQVDGSKLRFRFRSLWEAAKTGLSTLPVIALLRKLMLLDFSGRYVSSLFFNQALGAFYDKLLSQDEMRQSAAVQLLWYIAPALASVANGLLTYPFVNMPFSHFTRVRFHERQASKEASASAEAATYRRGETPAQKPNTKAPAITEELWIDKALALIVQWDVRDYLYFTYKRSGVAGLYRGFSMLVSAIFLGTGMGTASTAALGALREALRARDAA